MRCRGGLHQVNRGGGVGDEDITLCPTHGRLAVYRDCVLETFWEVLHCLLEEEGRRDGAGDGRGGNGLYNLGEAPSACRDACKVEKLDGITTSR